MTNIELTQLTQLLHNDPNKFYTDLSAHNKGYTTQHSHIFSHYNLYKSTILEYISKQVPHLLEHYVRYEGKLTQKIDNIDVYYNLNLYDDKVISQDITKDRLHLYTKVLHQLSDDNKTSLYDKIDISNYILVLNNDLIVPIRHLKEEYLVLYINYMSTKSNFESFLVELNRADFIIEHYSLLKNDVIDKYIMKNVTIINENVVKSLIHIGLSVSAIIKYNPKTLHYIVPYINTLDEVKYMMSVINSSTKMDTITLILDTFPQISGIIERKIEQIIKG